MAEFVTEADVVFNGVDGLRACYQCKRRICPSRFSKAQKRTKGPKAWCEDCVKAACGGGAETPSTTASDPLSNTRTSGSLSRDASVDDVSPVSRSPPRSNHSANRQPTAAPAEEMRNSRELLKMAEVALEALRQNQDQTNKRAALEEKVESYKTKIEELQVGGRDYKFSIHP